MVRILGGHPDHHVWFVRMSNPTGNETLHNTISGQAFTMASDYDRAAFYRRLAEEATRNYEKGRSESIDKSVSDALRRLGRLYPVDVAEAEALGKTRWAAHHVGMTYARDASYYREMTIFYATLHNAQVGR